MNRPLQLWVKVSLLLLLTAPTVRAETSTLPEESTKDISSTHSVTGTEVVVSGTRSIVTDRSADNLIVAGDKVRGTSRYGLLDALAAEDAGIYVTGGGMIHGVSNGATGGVTIRGLSGSPNTQVLVVEDGVPDYQGIFGHPLPDAYVPTLLDRALVVKGGDSTLYGTNALGGVIVLRSRWLEREGYELSSDSAYGSYATERETLSFLGRSGGWDLAAAFHAMKTDGHRLGTSGDQLVSSLAVRRRYGTRLSLTLRDKFLRLNGGDPGTASHPYADHWFHVWRDNASLRVDYQDGIWQLAVVSYYNIGVHELYDGYRSTDVTTGTLTQGTLALNRQAHLLLGIGEDHVGGQVENRIVPDGTSVHPTSHASAWGQLTLTPLPGVTLVAGGRGLYSSRYGSVPLYKAGVRLGPWKGVALHSRVSRNFREPTLRELYLPYPTANPELKPEYSTDMDLGVSFSTKHLTFDVTGYRTSMDNMIKYFGSWPAAEVINIDHMTIWGLEGRVGLVEWGPLSFRVSGNYQHVGRYTRQNPSGKVNGMVELTQPLGRDKVSVNLSGEWVTGLYMANYQRQPMADVFFVDLGVRFNHPEPKHGYALEPYVLVRNLLDRCYAYVEGYPMPGFNILAGLKLTTLP